MTRRARRPSSADSNSKKITLSQPRMAMYQKFVADLDASGEKLSGQMSEIDLSDPEDVRATVPARGSDLLLHFGQENFLSRYRVYQSHLNEWEQQYPRLAAVHTDSISTVPRSPLA